ncbi:MAG: hypothetical protein KJO07_21625 [Deltaproteobacteria bacterium]|jgi:hypothetical protein|nr:hypothetical protein [Deltaproteobacteria bacterium]
MNRITTPLKILLAALAIAIAAPSVASAQEAPKEVPPEVKRKRMKKLFAIIKREPSIKQVHKYAVEHYELETSRINSMTTRAHVKALVPEVEAGLDNMVGNNFQNTRDGLFPAFGDPNNPNNFKERVAGGNDQTTWRVRAVWNLDRLVFNPEALDAKSLTSLQENLVREVTTMFYARRRILASLIVSPPKDQEEYFYELMRLEEMTATLDSFTGGKFAKRTWQWDDPKWLSKTAVRKKRRGPRLPGLANLGR